MGGIYHYMPSVFIEIPHYMPCGVRVALQDAPIPSRTLFIPTLKKYKGPFVAPPTTGLQAISPSTYIDDNVISLHSLNA